MQVFTCLWNSTMLGSLDLLPIDSYDTLNRDHARSNSRIWRNLFWKQKSWQLSFAQPPPMPYTFMRVVLWFHIAILNILRSFKLIASQVCYVHFLHGPYTYTTSITVRHGQSYKGSSSPWNKKNTSKVSHHTHESLLKKEKRGRW